MEERDFRFTEAMWLWQGQGAWYFVTVPKELSDRIRFFFVTGKRRGWTSVRVGVRVGTTSWKTSIFWSNDVAAFILPIKAEVRKAERLTLERPIDFSLTVIQ